MSIFDVLENLTDGPKKNAAAARTHGTGFQVFTPRLQEKAGASAGLRRIEHPHSIGMARI
jgi:hypothetical protein